MVGYLPAVPRLRAPTLLCLDASSSGPKRYCDCHPQEAVLTCSCGSASPTWNRDSCYPRRSPGLERLALAAAPAAQGQERGNVLSPGHRTGEGECSFPRTHWITGFALQGLAQGRYQPSEAKGYPTLCGEQRCPSLWGSGAAVRVISPGEEAAQCHSQRKTLPKRGSPTDQTHMGTCGIDSHSTPE